MLDALQLIISKSSAAASDAADCIRAVRSKSPVLMQRYERVVSVALSTADFSADERALIASYLTPVASVARTKTLGGVRVNDDDIAAAKSLAEKFGYEYADWVRMRITSSEAATTL